MNRLFKTILQAYKQKKSMINQLINKKILSLHFQQYHNLSQQPSIQNLIKVQEHIQTLNSNPDYIKKFHLSSSHHNQKIDRQFIAVYENQFKVRIGKLNSQNERENQKFRIDCQGKNSNIQKEDQQNQQSEQNLFKDLHFQTVPYDAHFITANPYSSETSSYQNLIVSNRSMPVRIYQLQASHENKSLTYCTFKDHKPNSEAFLSPYEFSIQNKRIVGVGRKFCSVYDCEKIITSRLKAFYRLHLSTLELMSDEQTVLIGDFIGNIYQIDLRQQNKVLNNQPIKPHVDAVFHVKSFESNPYMFMSSARKDNFTYLFDRRNLSTFVSHFEFQRHSNQRYGLATKNDMFAIGSQDGSIFVASLGSERNQSSKEIVFEDLSKFNIADISLERTGNQQIQVFYSLGTRFYSEMQDEQDQIKKDANPSMNFGIRSFVHNL